jgi:hypothetical protein
VLTSVASFAGWSVNLHADATHAYVTRYCDYDIARVPLAGGGQPEVVWAEISNNASRFAADAQALYLWSSTPLGLVKLAK